MDAGGNQSDAQHSTILIVDDNAFNREILEMFLHTGGWRNLVLVENGLEALQQIDNGLKPDLVLLDLSMPVMDGFELCEKLRGRDDTRDLPVLVQTAMTSLDDRRRAFTAGATDFITKPVFKEELIARTRIHLENRLQRRHLQQFYTRVSAELEAARAMQHLLVPSEATIETLRETARLDVAAHYHPATELGGDMWGTYTLPDGKTAIYCADFSGHGVASAINTFRLHVMLHSLGQMVSANPSAALEYLNAELHNTLPRGQYLAIFYAVIDRVAGTIAYAAASMPDALLVRGKQVQRLSGSGLPVGITRAATHQTSTAPFMPGDTLLLFSDGMIEGRNREGLLISHDDIAAALNTTQSLTAPSALRAALALIDQSPAAVGDDLTVIAVQAL